MIEKMYTNYVPYKFNYYRVQFYSKYFRTPFAERREMNNFLCILKSERTLVSDTNCIILLNISLRDPFFVGTPSSSLFLS